MTCVSCASSRAAQYDPIADLYDGYPGCYLEDIPFFLDEASRVSGPVLEIGVGTGRLALVLAAAGVDVVGIDSSPAMLRVLERKRAQWPDLPGRVRPLAADTRCFALRQRFALAIVPFRTFLYLLTRADQRRGLRTIRRHLALGGRLVLAFFVPPTALLRLRRTAQAEMTRFSAPDGPGEVIAYDWTEFVAHQSVISHITYQRVNARGRPIEQREHTLVCRYLLPEEVPPLLESCGYRVVAAYGGFDRRPLTADSHEQIWIAARAEKRRKTS